MVLLSLLLVCYGGEMDTHYLSYKFNVLSVSTTISIYSSLLFLQQVHLQNKFVHILFIIIFCCSKYSHKSRPPQISIFDIISVVHYWGTRKKTFVSHEIILMMKFWLCNLGTYFKDDMPHHQNSYYRNLVLDVPFPGSCVLEYTSIDTQVMHTQCMAYSPEPVLENKYSMRFF